MFLDLRFFDLLLCFATRDAVISEASMMFFDRRFSLFRLSDLEEPNSFVEGRVFVLLSSVTFLFFPATFSDEHLSIDSIRSKTATKNPFVLSSFGLARRHLGPENRKKIWKL